MQSVKTWISVNLITLRFHVFVPAGNNNVVDDVYDLEMLSNNSKRESIAR